MERGGIVLTTTNRPAIFLDRDGVINHNRSDHVKSWAEFEFLPGVFEALARLARLKVPIIVITNQGAIGRGLTTFEAVDEIHARMVLAIQEHGGRVDDVLYCPHKPDDRCDCRKPQPGMLKLAAQRWQIDLKQSVLIGDADTDILAATAVGCRSGLVLSGRGRNLVARLPQLGLQDIPCFDHLNAAVDWIAMQILAASQPAFANVETNITAQRILPPMLLHEDGSFAMHKVQPRADEALASDSPVNESLANQH